MSAPWAVEDVFVWAFSKNDDYAGYHFWATPKSAQEVGAILSEYAHRIVANESCTLKLKPVTRRALRTVNCSSAVRCSFEKLRLKKDTATNFAESGGDLSVTVAREDLDILLEALQAMSDGISDFDALDGRVWFWVDPR